MKKIGFVLFVAILFVKPLFSQSPSIDSISPASGQIGTQVTIYGSGFSNITDENIVYFGGAFAVVNNSAEDSLNVVVPVGASYNTVTVTTHNLTAFSDLPFNAINTEYTAVGATSFDSIVEYVTSRWENFDGSVADFNKDGKVDLITTNSGDSSVSILANESVHDSLLFSQPSDISTLDFPDRIAIADLDGDGWLDLVVGNYSQRKFSTFLNTSTTDSISFEARMDYSVGTYTADIDISDIDKDGKPDLIVVCNTDTSVLIYRNTSIVGTLSFEDPVKLQTGIYPLGCEITDIDFDGLPDLAIINRLSNSFTLLKNKSTVGNLVFDDREDIAVKTQPISLGYSDLNQDNMLDFYITYYMEDSITVLMNTTEGENISFKALQFFDASGSCYNISAGDLDGDGKPDLILPNAATELYFMKNTSTNGDISFAQATGINVDGMTDYASLADLNGDGKVDIISGASGKIKILINHLTFTGIGQYIQIHVMEILW
jgi:hypothetical protein